MTSFRKFGPLLVFVAMAWPQPSSAQRAEYATMVSTHAQANGVPVDLVHRVIMRESRYNPSVVHRGNYGMMQIKLATARGLGYTGTAEGLLDPETNLTYAVKYLAGAYRLANGNHDRAVAYYASGYYYAAKRQKLQRVRHETMSADARLPGAPLSIAPR
ncbi:soluble lytic murein transglycosylase-like protein [Nitrobacter winogradskyi]|uniref:Soluble lytic murein transglycosylase-like protein n=1 Tax=Nitrobacter winogradskyi TaxID=913 RepID=A0ACC6AJ20_NITWI|nr:soluble lytic murein transglycosylase-like protein [Nitrobacter winogradskyi]